MYRGNWTTSPSFVSRLCWRDLISLLSAPGYQGEISLDPDQSYFEADRYGSGHRVLLLYGTIGRIL